MSGEAPATRRTTAGVRERHERYDRTERQSPRARRLREPEPPSRRRVLTRRLVALAVLLVLLGTAYVALFTPLLGVRTIEVSGLRELTAQRVRAAANVSPGSPLLRLDTDAVAANVHQLPGVAAVEVDREYPGTLHITVTEQDVVAVFRAADGLRVVDATGQPLHTVGSKPAGLPELKLPRVSRDDRMTRAVLRVLTGLPKDLARAVRTATANSPLDVRLTLRSGRLVKWGDADDGARKAQVLRVLLSRPGKVYDVASPGAPTVR